MADPMADPMPDPLSGPIVPGPGYQAASQGAALCPDTGRAFLLVTGKAPREMLNGLLSNSLPPEPARPRGSVVYSALLNAKGRMITDLRVFSGLEGGFLLEIPAVGLEGAATHFRKYLPPRLARVEDRSSLLAGVTLLGPESPRLLAVSLRSLGLSLSREEVAALGEGEEMILSDPNHGAFRLVGNGGFSGPAWDLILPADAAGGVRRSLAELDAAPISDLEMETLRVEKGRPVFGKDLDESTIPVEAGIQGRAIDHGKGCYTGQEVIVRLRDRGQVNKELRGLLLGDAPTPEPGRELFEPGWEKSVGWVTSSVASPRFGQTIALGYLRRRVAPGDTVRLGGLDGPEARVMALTDEGWVLD